MFSRSLILCLLAAFVLVAPQSGHAQPVQQTKGSFEDKFRQLDGEDIPPANDYRNASGAPGHRYWQQKVDYRIEATLDEDAKSLSGAATISYTNNSPDNLRYLWLLLDQNRFKRDSMAERSRTVSGGDSISFTAIRRAERYQDWEGGFEGLSVTDGAGNALPFTVVDALMRIDLPQPLAPGATTEFSIRWRYSLIETRVIGGRSGYECFTKKSEDGNCIFLGAQWFPRLAVYSDYEGWHNKTFLGAGEFTLEFGDYDVALTVPSDHIVSATGEIANPEEALSAAQRQRLTQARNADEPVYIVTPAEAAANERSRAGGSSTWRFTARNVRDFAWASSRKFIWDAQGVQNEHPDHPLVMAMSFYPKEGRPLWDAYSTKSVAHTLKVYGSFAFPYPYPTAQSVNGPVGGMEYPMITFNGPRPIKDKKTGELTYTERAKYGLIGVIIHEIGHIWFPMTVNSDERQWTWMDEGLNTFLQFQAERQWDEDYPVRRGEPHLIADYMLSENQVPIMTQSDSVVQFGNNSYAKPAAALTILRETVMGRELFDHAFREYARQWAFKRPTPADFFRTMEEASGVDLDWFWRGWFYSTDHVDIALTDVVKARIDTRDPEVEKAYARGLADQEPGSLTVERNTEPTVVERDPAVRDYYNETDKFTVTASDRRKYKGGLEDLEPEERAALQSKNNFYNLTFQNLGGLVMPVIVKMDFTDGSSETVRIPAEIWRYNSRQVTWQYVTPKQLRQVELDPRWETADADRSNNYFPQRIDPATLEVRSFPPRENRMKDDDKVVTPDSLRTRSKAK